MKKTVMLLSVLLLLAGCGTGERSGTDGVESENSARAVCVSEEDCWLCGNGSAELEEWGQKNNGFSTEQNRKLPGKFFICPEVFSITWET